MVNNGKPITTQIFFKNRCLDEPGYLLFVRKNALQILIPKFGLEGTVYLPDSKDSPFEYDEQVRVCSYVKIDLVSF